MAEHIEEICARMLADLWNAPDIDRSVGVATIGSSEAIMLGLLAHKFTLAQPAQGGRAPDRQAQRGVRGRDPHRVGQVRPLLRRRDAQDPDAHGPLRHAPRRRRGPHRREHHRRRRRARHHLHRRERPDLGDQRPPGADQEGEGLGHPAPRRRGQRRLHRPLRPPRRGVGLPARAGEVDQRLGPQVRAGLPGHRLAGLPRPRGPPRGPRVRA